MGNRGLWNAFSPLAREMHWSPSPAQETMPISSLLQPRRRHATSMGPALWVGAAGSERARAAEDDGLSTRLMDHFRLTGDGAAFEDLMQRNAPMLRRMILARLRATHASVDVNDVLQDTFFNIYRYPSRFRADRPAAFRIWASTIVRNTVHRHMRRSMRRGVRMESAAEALMLSPDPAPGPLQLVVNRDEGATASRSFALLLIAWSAAYHELRDRDRRVLHLVEVEGRPYREAAEILGVRPGNLKMLVFRARRRIALRIGTAFENAPGVAEA